MIELLTRNTDVIIAAMAALSVFSACMVLLWPYFARDTLALRMREVAAERENIRIRERTRLQAGKKASLRTEPKKLFKDIVDRLNLNAQADDGQIVQQLRMAGYRGRAPVITFVAVRLIMPFALFAVATFYVFVVLQLQQAFVLKLGMALAVALLGYYGPALYLKNRVTKRLKVRRPASASRNSLAPAASSNRPAAAVPIWLDRWTRRGRPTRPRVRSCRSLSDSRTGLGTPERTTGHCARGATRGRVRNAEWNSLRLVSLIMAT
jgi:hypothetical protein